MNLVRLVYLHLMIMYIVNKKACNKKYFKNRFIRLLITLLTYCLSRYYGVDTYYDNSHWQLEIRNSLLILTLKK